ncbi:Inositol-1,4,5-trisphosphate 5-phosphatase 1 [Mycoemilia scoparia]|uniref:Inositol-1,4,5-trisphosphate 5-phosphatase 1 n=1 Tax=Mycoemilia scoparia TaxID=417184 RepID=A0A9W8DSJ6_9FUNG|nr:Inositol-1,4,5-trisphosphate 5-phosphatase 1 [Mycoemilia scoparia]
MPPQQFIVYVRDNPRSVALVPTHAPEGHEQILTISVAETYGQRQQPQVPTPPGQEDSVACQIDMKPADEALKYYMPLAREPVYGCIGVFNYDVGIGSMDTYIMLVTKCRKIGNIGTERMNEGRSQEIYCVTGVDTLSLTTNQYDFEEVPYMPGSIEADEDFYDDPVRYGSDNPTRRLISFFQRGTFYFSPSFDITRNLQARKLMSSSVIVDVHKKKNSSRAGNSVNILGHGPDMKFTWNRYFLDAIYQCRNTLTPEMCQIFDNLSFALPLMGGNIDIVPLVQGISPTSQHVLGKVAIISRSSSLRAGMRFLTRGIDDAGGVANEVETEMIFITKDYTFSLVQLRGSVPVFWEQTGFQIGAHKIKLTRMPQAAYPAAKLHFQDLLERYKSVHILNLLKSTPDAQGGHPNGNGGMGQTTANSGGGEYELLRAYETQVRLLDLPTKLLKYTSFDYHAAVKNNQHQNVQMLISAIEGDLRKYQYFLMSNADGTILKLQRGVMRTNCMDCLDRTNVVQNVVARTVITAFLNGSGFENNSQTSLNAALNLVGQMWSRNGNEISIAYTGTGALKSQVTTTGKSTFSGLLSDFSKSVNRLLQNNIYDEKKQTIIDAIMGRDPVASPPLIWLDPYAEMLRPIIKKRIDKISKHRNISILATTYNLHGRPYRGENLEDWLRFPKNQIPDIVVVGFQEIVNLNVGQVLATNNANRLVWEQIVMKLLNKQLRTREEASEYVLVCSDQLVGMSILVIAHSSILPLLKGVSTVNHKTGLWGMTGNKGAVAASLEVGDTSFCFISSHFASGTPNVAERNGDFYNIYQNVRFLRHRMIDNHHYVIWVGDLNYRIDLPNHIARDLAWNFNIPELLKHDQLANQKGRGAIFRDYYEGPITFLPTYKYDTGTDNYDSSEKQRVPSWTDRILYKGQGLELESYYRDELTFSDHKPVSGLFNAQVITIDKSAKARVMREVYATYVHMNDAILDSHDVFPQVTHSEPKVDVLVDVDGDQDGALQKVESKTTGSIGIAMDEKSSGPVSKREAKSAKASEESISSAKPILYNNSQKCGAYKKASTATNELARSSAKQEGTPAATVGGKINEVTVTAPVNIAVVKYWGKRDKKLILPTNSSLSCTLSQDHLHTRTTIRASPNFTYDRLWLNGVEERIDASERLLNCINTTRQLRQELEQNSSSSPEGQEQPPMSTWGLHICSENNFPTAAGLASSASGYAALVMALAKLFKLPQSEQDISKIARTGSGSACRSIFGGFVAWEMGEKPDGSDSYAVQIAPESHWPDLQALICVISDAKKGVSSTSGMQTTVQTSDLFKERVDVVVPKRMEEMKKAILDRDFQTFAKLAMKDSNQFHACCLDTYPPIFYMNDTSRGIIQLIHHYNSMEVNPETGEPIIKAAYTFDAGPNAVIYAPKKYMRDLIQIIALLFPRAVDMSNQVYYTDRFGIFTREEYSRLGSELIDTEASSGENGHTLEELRDRFPVFAPGSVRRIIHTEIGDGPRVLTGGHTDSLLNDAGMPKRARD